MTQVSRLEDFTTTAPAERLASLLFGNEKGRFESTTEHVQGPVSSSRNLPRSATMGSKQCVAVIRDSTEANEPLGLQYVGDQATDIPR
jgi:hypothetical protein